MASLQDEVTSLTTATDRLQAELQQQTRQRELCERQLAAMNNLPPDRWAMVPKAEAIRIDERSGLRSGRPAIGPLATRPDDDPDAMIARLYIIVVDAANVPIRAAGPMTLSLFDLSADPPITVARHEFPPEQVLRGFRTGLVNNQYVFDLPLDRRPIMDRAMARVHFIDYLTGKTLVAEQTLTTLPR